jgi:hypothetical protein
MKNGRIVSSKKIAEHLIGMMERNIYERLLAYCKRRVVEVGLTTLALVGDQDLVSNMPLARKNLARLKTLVYKYLVKRIPYLALAQAELLQMSNRDSVDIVIQSSEMTSDFKHVDWEAVTGTTGARGRYSNFWLRGTDQRHRDLAMRSHPSFKWVERYCNYINYLCRKHRAPFGLSPSFEIHFDERMSEELYHKTSKEKAEAIIPFTVRVKIKVSFVTWVSNNAETLERIRKGEVENDAFFTGNDWMAYNLIGQRHVGRDPGFSAQKIFLHLDKVVNVLSHLTRKAYYETSAYSFRSNPDS